MDYKIISGKYETGTQEQQQSYSELFGSENIQYKFDLYFHWFNLVHEIGHCLVASKNINMAPVEEELFANRFAVSYWRNADGGNNLENLMEMLSGIISSMPNPIPVEKDFKSFFTEIWGSETMQTVQMYGYFQLSCVLEAFKNNEALSDVLGEIGFDITSTDNMKKYEDEVSVSTADDVLKLCMDNLKAVGVPTDDINVSLELVENPEIQCAEIVNKDNKVKVKLKDKLLSAATICLCIIVITLSLLNLIGKWKGALDITTPLLGLIQLLLAIEHWNQHKKTAIFCLCIALFIFAVTAFIWIF